MDPPGLVTPPPSRLLALPAELRLCIYDFLFIPIRYPGPAPPDPSDKASQKLALLLTCRQIRHEARAIAFSRTTFHIPSLIEPLLDRLFLLHTEVRRTLRYVTITLNLSIAPKILNFMDPWLMELPLEQLTIIIRKLRPVDRPTPSSASLVEPTSIEEARAYSYIPASSLRFEIQMKNLKRAICRGLLEPSKIKQITLLHDGCCYGNKFVALYQILALLVRSEEHSSSPRRWDVSLDQGRHAIDIVSASAAHPLSAKSPDDIFNEIPEVSI